MSTEDKDQRENPPGGTKEKRRKPGPVARDPHAPDEHWLNPRARRRRDRSDIPDDPAPGAPVAAPSGSPRSKPGGPIDSTMPRRSIGDLIDAVHKRTADRLDTTQPEPDATEDAPQKREDGPLPGRFVHPPWMVDAPREREALPGEQEALDTVYISPARARQRYRVRSHPSVERPHEDGGELGPRPPEEPGFSNHPEGVEIIVPPPVIGTARVEIKGYVDGKRPPPMGNPDDVAALGDYVTQRWAQGTYARVTSDTTQWRERKSGNHGYHSGFDWAAPMGTKMVLADTTRYRWLVAHHHSPGSPYGIVTLLFPTDKTPEDLSEVGKMQPQTAILFAHGMAVPDGFPADGTPVELGPGDVAHIVGSTGNSEGPHIHFELVRAQRFKSSWGMVQQLEETDAMDLMKSIGDDFVPVYPPGTNHMS